MGKLVLLWVATALIAFSANVSALSANTQTYPAAIMPFDERGAGLRGYGLKVTDALFASLVTYPQIYLVDRQEIKKVLAEYQLNLSGMVNPNQANRIGQITGAKILISGAITEIDNTLLLVVKIIGTETSRVFGASVRGRSGDNIIPLVENLAEKIKTTILQRSDQIVPPVQDKIDVAKTINQALGERKRPTVTINIAERHVGRSTFDPAAETELMVICQQTNFEVFDTKNYRSKKADIVIKGEGFSEFAGRHGELISVKARLELKALDPSSGKIIAVDRQTIIEVDLAEELAGKKALQRAAAAIAVRLLPKLVE